MAVWACLAAAMLMNPMAAGAYRNPLGGMTNIGDPDVLFHEGIYYMYPTSNTDTGSHTGFRVFQSKNLVNWQSMGWALLKTSSSYGQYDFWAPDVVYRAPYFYMFYSTRHTHADLLRICVARADSPLGPFVEYKAPLFEGRHDAIDPCLFTDTDGRNYLYWSSGSTNTRGYNTIAAQPISADFTRMMGKARLNALGPPFSSWETLANQALSIVEAPGVFKRNGLYYLVYSANSFLSPDYAVGYATSRRPLGPFTRSTGNPILHSDMSLPVSGPGSHSLIDSPDGTELFIVYHAHADPATPSADREMFIDRVRFEGDRMFVDGPTLSPQPEPSGAQGVVVYQDDEFTSSNLQPPGSPTGWSIFGMTKSPDLATAYWDEASGSYRAQINGQDFRTRNIGVMSNKFEWMPYSLVGSNNYVRGKFFLYAGGQDDPSRPETIPNISVRVSTRFAATAIYYIMHHDNHDPSNNPRMQELRPSTDPQRPSIYRVDFDPIDVPFLSTTTSYEGIMHGFEAISVDREDNGYIAMTESQLMVYPTAMLPNSTDPAVLRKVYAPGATDAGDLRVFHPESELRVENRLFGTFEGDTPALDTSDAPRPAYTEGPWGVTADSTAVPSDRIGIVLRDFYAGSDLAARVRMEEGKQYKIRFHVTSTQRTDRQSSIQFRARSIKFAWGQKLVLGGAFCTARGGSNSTMCIQGAPGVGSLNPEKNGTENGGWYTMLFASPMSADIRPEFPEYTPLATRMPLICAQPGPGVNAPSQRDLKLGFTLEDSMSTSGERHLEQANFTIDRVEVYVHDVVAD